MIEKPVLSGGQLIFWQKEITENPCLESISDCVLSAYSLIEKSYSQGGKLLICGNGGSAADADHIVGELMKGFEKKRPLSENIKSLLDKYPGGGRLAERLQGALPAINLAAHTSLLTAFSNDIGYEEAYAQQVLGYGRPGDVLLGISTSGNSENILLACIAAKAAGLSVIAMTGEKSGSMSEISDVTIRANVNTTRNVQDIHSVVYHAICVLLEMHFWPPGGCA